MEENTQVKKEDAEILENEQKGGKKKWMKYAKIGFLLLVAVFWFAIFIKIMIPIKIWTLRSTGWYLRERCCFISFIK